MPYSNAERERVFKAGYEFYNVDDDYMQDRVKSFIAANPWAEEHANLVFPYIRTLTDYKVISQFDGANDIRLRNSLITSIDKLHKQLFSYKDADNDSEEDGMDELFNPLKMANS